MKHDISTDQLRAINYFHTVHEAVVQMSSVSQIVKCLEREQKHSALVPAHYTSTSDIQEAVLALAAAQRDMDMKRIRTHKELSICEDGNKLHSMAGRGFMVKVLENYGMKEIFVNLKDPSKSPEMKWDDLESIDTGLDTFKAMQSFVQNDLQKECRDIASIATDWSGTNGGSNNGASARV